MDVGTLLVSDSFSISYFDVCRTNRDVLRVLCYCFIIYCRLSDKIRMVRIDVALDTVAKADCFLLQDIDG